MDDFVIHACEQVLRFGTVDNWEDLSDKSRMQLSFNVGVMALGLSLSKEDGYQALADVCQGNTSMENYRKHVMSLVMSHDVQVNEENIKRPF